MTLEKIVSIPGMAGLYKVIAQMRNGGYVVESLTDQKRIPIDPMLNSKGWGKRAYQDAPDTTSWGGKNVFDIYTKGTGAALDGTKYRDW